MTGFVERLVSASLASRSLVCVGLDPDPDLMAIADVADFNAQIVDATRDLVCAYKPNFPFYEALGIPGLLALERTVEHIRDVAPGVVLIADCKRGDIGSTNKMYARALFETWGFDAATVNAWGGGDSIEPYLEYNDRGVFVWCRSSNAGAAEFQDVPVSYDGGSVPLFEWMAVKAAEWNRASSNVGIVVGATYPSELAAVRARCPGMPILVPGVGSQGGDLDASLTNGLDNDSPNVLISSSRGIIYASRERDNFAFAARESASRLRDEINLVLERECRGW
jgi:orotidine-5'-phosphate decarboxylase